MPCSSNVSSLIHTTSLPFVLFLLSHLLYFQMFNYICLCFVSFHSLHQKYFLKCRSVVLIISRRYKFKDRRVCALTILYSLTNLGKYHMSKLRKSIIVVVRKNKFLRSRYFINCTSYVLYILCTSSNILIRYVQFNVESFLMYNIAI